MQSVHERQRPKLARSVPCDQPRAHQLLPDRQLLPIPLLNPNHEVIKVHFVPKSNLHEREEHPAYLLSRKTKFILAPARLKQPQTLELRQVAIVTAFGEGDQHVPQSREDAVVSRQLDTT